jgi:hypothetical protein
MHHARVHGASHVCLGSSDSPNSHKLVRSQFQSCPSVPLRIMAPRRVLKVIASSTTELSVFQHALLKDIKQLKVELHEKRMPFCIVAKAYQGRAYWHPGPWA